VGGLSRFFVVRTKNRVDGKKNRWAIAARSGEKINDLRRGIVIASVILGIRFRRRSVMTWNDRLVMRKKLGDTCQKSPMGV